MKSNNNLNKMGYSGLNDPQYDFFISQMEKASSSAESYPMQEFSVYMRENGVQRHLDMYKDYIKFVSDRISLDHLDTKLLSISNLNKAINTFYDRTFTMGVKPEGFVMLVPVKVYIMDETEPPHLTICIVSNDGKYVNFGEARGSNLMNLVPESFKHQAYGLAFAKDINGERLSFADNLLVQLNYYRSLYGLGELSF